MFVSNGSGKANLLTLTPCSMLDLRDCTKAAWMRVAREGKGGVGEWGLFITIVSNYYWTYKQ